MKGRSESSPFSRLWVFLRPYQLILLGTVVLIIGNVASNLSISYAIGKTLDMGLDANSSGFWQAFTLIVIAWVASDVFYYFRYRASRQTAERVAHDIRQSVAAHLGQVQLADLEKQHSGDYVSRLSNDIENVKNVVAIEWVNLVRGSVAFIAAAVVMMLVSWRVTLASMLVTPVFVLVANAFSKPIGRHTTAFQAEMAKVNALAQDATAGITVTKAFNLKPVLKERLQLVGQSVVRESTDLGFSRGKMNATMMLLSMLPLLILFGVGGYEVTQGRLTMGQLLMLLNLLNNLTWPLQSMSQSLAQLKAGLKASTRIFDLLLLPIERTDGSSVVVNNTADYAIELLNVTFGYTQDNAVFANLNLSIRPGESVAIVGPSGTGKSTLFSLLLGLRKPNHGEINYFGQPIDSLSLASLRQKIAYVPQEALLFPTSVEENIRYGSLHSSDEQVQAAAKVAYAHDFIQTLPGSYETNLGEQGTGLSGGQKQRISLARAIIRNAPVLLLDEATSALDTESEMKVQEAIDQLSHDKTTIIIAHRLSTIKSVDRIIVLDEGRVVEEGQHEALLAQGGAYARLYHQQFSCQESSLVAAGH